MGRATGVKYNLLNIKPENVDRWWIFDIDANEQKVMQHSVLKSFFVKVDEDGDINANHEYQTNWKLKFGSAGEFQMYHDATDMYFEDVAPAGKLKFRYNSGTLGSPIMANSLTLDPVNDSIATYGNAINNTGLAGLGIKFDASNRPVLLSILQCNAGIALKLNNLSYSGAINTGFEMDTSSNVTAKQNLKVEGTTNVAILNASGQINANKGGTFALDATGQVRCRDLLLVNGTYILMSGSTQLQGGGGFGMSINVDEDIRCGSGKKYRVGSLSGISATIPNTFTNIIVSGGIITGFT